MTQASLSKRRGQGEDSIYWDASKIRYIGAVSLGFSPAGTRIRKKVTGRTKTEVRDKLRELHRQVEGGLRPRRRYTVEDALEDWLAIGLDGLSARTVTLYRDTATSIEPLVLMLTGTAPESPAAPPDLTGLALSVTRARKDYQACRYAELLSRLPHPLSQLGTACHRLTGDDRLRASALSADAYHVAAGFLLKTGDQGLAHVATDRSMTAALASQDPLTVGTSARVVTHTLTSSGHLTAAVTTAQKHAARLDHETGATTPESLSVCGSLLLRGALAAAQHDDRATAHEMLAEAAGTARRLGSDANLRGTAFGPVNTQMHQVNVAVTLGDAGTAIDLARQIDLRAVTVTERKASLLIDVARAFFQRGKYEQAHAALRAAEDTAPQEVARPAIRRHPGPRPGHPGPGEHPPGRRAVRHQDRRHQVTPGRHVLTIVACGAGPAAAIGTCVKLAQDRGWTVQVTATPAALDFFDTAAIAGQAGSPVRSQYAKPGSPRSLVPDAILVAPATYNTINKWAHGSSDTYALGVLAETTGVGVPTVVLPFVNTALADRAPFRRSVESLRAEGVTILLGSGGIQPHPPRTGGDLAATFPWHLGLDEAERMLAPAPPHP